MFPNLIDARPWYLSNLREKGGFTVAVYYKCKVCGQEHKSPIAFGDKKSFESSKLVNNAFQCPKTGKMAGYNKEDMFWKEQ